MCGEISSNAKIGQRPATSAPAGPTPAQACPTAALLIAHGSRRQAANEDLIRLAQLVRDRGIYDCVEIAYLELAEPTIPQGIRQCIDQGSRRVLMLPYFLSAGEHVAGDLEHIRSTAAVEFPQVSFELCAPLGTHPLVVEAVLARLRETGEPPA